MISLFLSLILNFFGKPYIAPAKTEVIIASPSAILEMPKDNTPWGTTEKIGEHLYRTYVGSDPVMGTPAEILDALNLYRKNHNISPLELETNLCPLAQKRAEDQSALGGLDSHKGLTEYMDDPNHWKELDIRSIGENASYGYVLSGTHLIEWVFDADTEHRENQLNPDWRFACVGSAGKTVDIIFAKK